jgi:hypothetical protein
MCPELHRTADQRRPFNARVASRPEHTKQPELRSLVPCTCPLLGTFCTRILTFSKRLRLRLRIRLRTQQLELRLRLSEQLRLKQQQQLRLELWLRLQRLWQLELRLRLRLRTRSHPAVVHLRQQDYANLHTIRCNLECEPLGDSSDHVGSIDAYVEPGVFCL